MAAERAVRMARGGALMDAYLTAVAIQAFIFLLLCLGLNLLHFRFGGSP